MLTCSEHSSVYADPGGVATVRFSQNKILHPSFSWLVLHVLCHAVFALVDNKLVISLAGAKDVIMKRPDFKQLVMAWCSLLHVILYILLRITEVNIQKMVMNLHLLLCRGKLNLKKDYWSFCSVLS